MLPIIYHENYDIPVPKAHSFVGTKFSDLFNNLQKKYSQNLDVLEPFPAQLNNLKESHDVEYINKVSKDELTKDYLKLINLPWSARLRDRSYLETEGTYLTAKTALDRGLACHVGGGTHHAHYDHGFGFCVFNDLAYTAIRLIKEKLVKQVLILDLDVHQGDGTIDICHKYSSIYTCSMHSETNFPYDKKQGCMDIGLPSHIEDHEYLNKLEETLEKIKQHITPEIVLYDAGVDVFRDDKLGNLKVSLEGIRQRDLIVLDHYRKLNTPVATVIGGGYSKDKEELAERHSIIFETAIKYL
ncbi:histone deacetylase [Alphaproteobacteria bacterium]|jgi:acetoin utilization deacetylase AcuC-like enzyme|nr:histone deacetylase [Alphaproteobacteria bacterium]|tara:strand:- start:1373 stop:2269 length:897 start_codon:yes stop_codon:yes gene_type:complete